jgi:hypothetical protein
LDVDRSAPLVQCPQYSDEWFLAPVGGEFPTKRDEKTWQRGGGNASAAVSNEVLASWYQGSRQLPPAHSIAV